MAQALEPDPAAVGGTGAGLAQVAQQASETAQNAAAQATATQEGAMNVAAPTVTASPGAETTVTQTNDAVADAVAENDSETTQAAGQSQSGAANGNSANGNSAASQPPSTGQGQTAQQGSSTTQGAGAQATTVQTQPINVAIPIVIGSPRAKTVVNQVNNAAAGASATNSATTTQIAGQVKSGLSQGGSGQAQKIGQFAVTKQDADADADAKQNAVNANTPVAVAGGDIVAGNSSANQTGNNSAYAEASNKSATLQLAAAKQEGGGSSCKAGCGGPGQYQAIFQGARDGPRCGREAERRECECSGLDRGQEHLRRQQLGEPDGHELGRLVRV